MKKIYSVILLVLVSLSAFASEEVLVLTDSVYNKVYDRINTLDQRTLTQLRAKLNNIDSLLDGALGPEQIECIKHSSSYLSYALTNMDGDILSTKVSQTDCHKLLRSRKGDLLCTKMSASYLGYQVLQASTGRTVGAMNAMKDCVETIATQKRGFMCAKVSNSYMGYQLIRLRGLTSLSTTMTLSECKSQL